MSAYPIADAHLRPSNDKEARRVLARMWKTLETTKSAPSADPTDVTLPDVAPTWILLAADYIDATGIDIVIEEWIADDRVSKRLSDGKPPKGGGRNGTVSVREYLIASIACAINRIAASQKQIAHVLNQPLAKHVRKRLEPADPERLARLHRARKHYGVDDGIDDSAVGRIADTINRTISPKTYPADRRYSHEELDEYDRNRTPWDIAMIPIRQKRMDDLSAAMLLPSWFLVPEEYRRHWRGDLTCDATVVPIWGDGHKRCKASECKKRDGSCGHWIREAREANAGYHAKQDSKRPYAERDGKTGDTEYTHGYDYHYALTTGPGVGTLFPAIIIAGRFDRPGHAPGKNLADALRSIVRAGLIAGHVTTDMGYSQLSPENYATIVRELGYEPIMMYKDNELGIQETYGGCKLVEGKWYGPCLPQELANANIDYKANRIGYDQWRTRIKRRKAYQMRIKSATQTESSYVMRCPSHGDGATATCDYREVTPNDAALVDAGRKTLELIINHPDRNLPACRNEKTVSIPKHVGARWLQDLPYKSDEWIAVYGPERNQIEGKNSEAKNSLLAGLKEPGHRRQIGMAKQLIAILARSIATNIHSLLRFLKKADAAQPKPDFTPLSPYGHRWWSSKDDSVEPHRITGRRLAEITDDPPMRPTPVPEIPQVA